MELSVEATKRIEQCRLNNLCLACLKPIKGKSIRGLDVSCYKATRRMIAAGHTTETQRMQEGKLIGCATPGRKPSNPVALDILGSDA